VRRCSRHHPDLPLHHYFVHGRSDAGRWPVSHLDIGTNPFSEPNSFYCWKYRQCEACYWNHSHSRRHDQYRYLCVHLRHEFSYSCRARYNHATRLSRQYVDDHNNTRQWRGCRNGIASGRCGCDGSDGSSVRLVGVGTGGIVKEGPQARRVAKASTANRCNENQYCEWVRWSSMRR
jgi:hypothetical protein